MIVWQLPMSPSWHVQRLQVRQHLAAGPQAPYPAARTCCRLQAPQHLDLAAPAATLLALQLTQALMPSQQVQVLACRAAAQPQAPGHLPLLLQRLSALLLQPLPRLWLLLLCH